MKPGDRVRHEAGWLATVTRVTEQGTVIVTADNDSEGEYSPVVFEVVEEDGA